MAVVLSPGLSAEGPGPQEALRECWAGPPLGDTQTHSLDTQGHSKSPALLSFSHEGDAARELLRSSGTWGWGLGSGPWLPQGQAQAVPGPQVLLRWGSRPAAPLWKGHLVGGRVTARDSAGKRGTGAAPGQL